MFYIKPIHEEHLEDLYDLVLHSGYGLTTLPKDKEILLKRVANSERSFKYSIAGEPKGEVYLFGLFESKKSKLIGVSGLLSKIGGYEPFYFYRIKKEHYKSDSINVEKELLSLHLEAQHSGPSEIASLFLHPEYRKSLIGRFLSLTRFLYMAEFSEFFEEEVIAEMRGMVDDEGHSPFFENVGRHFFNIDFNTADMLSMKTKNFLRELHPPYPILVPLLPKEAQTIIGKVHPNTEPAKRILEYEGFSQDDLIGSLEPGPILKAKTKEIRSVKTSKVYEVSEISNKTIEGDQVIICNDQKKEFRSSFDSVSISNDKISVNKQLADLLNIDIGSKVRVCTFK